MYNFYGRKNKMSGICFKLTWGGGREEWVGVWMEICLWVHTYGR